MIDDNSSYYELLPFSERLKDLPQVNSDAKLLAQQIYKTCMTIHMCASRPSTSQQVGLYLNELDQQLSQYIKICRVHENF